MLQCIIVFSKKCFSQEGLWWSRPGACTRGQHSVPTNSYRLLWGETDLAFVSGGWATITSHFFAKQCCAVFLLYSVLSFASWCKQTVEDSFKYWWPVNYVHDWIEPVKGCRMVDDECVLIGCLDLSFGLSPVLFIIMHCSNVFFSSLERYKMFH